MELIQDFKDEHPDIYEFIMFNIFSNIATITNFAVLNLSKSIIFRSLMDVNFNWWIFNYSAAKGGLGGFLAFFFAYAAAQIVNFFVQREIVFKSESKLSTGLILYFLTVGFVYIICLYVPTLIMEPLTEIFGSLLATNITNGVNIMIQVALIYPMLKFVIMKDDKAENNL
ncbi:hypothetical protein [Halanaerobium praevalens]|uniref:GtrA-like protein domain-containing protein n=1 Tax=Halanaerobium praevalens (strain ATCC 33744 / DSM 2228 / GSL) TaxID=572479 RepID=E3DM03_HALPG|nr:hypothetical protein [Halanaerobium praevalens]ADO76262.1 hypothetical protein Hprae_0104 [Halanaerobium praevalens DSM 2228]